MITCEGIVAKNGRAANLRRNVVRCGTYGCEAFAGIHELAGIRLMATGSTWRVNIRGLWELADVRRAVGRRMAAWERSTEY